MQRFAARPCRSGSVCGKAGRYGARQSKQAPMSDISYTSSRSADVAQQRAPSRLGDVVFGGLARLAAIVTLLLLGGIIVSLIIASMPTIRSSASASCGNPSGIPTRTSTARFRADLQHDRDVGHRARHRGAGQLRHRAVPRLSRFRLHRTTPAFSPQAVTLRTVAAVVSVGGATGGRNRTQTETSEAATTGTVAGRNAATGTGAWALRRM